MPTLKYRIRHDERRFTFAAFGTLFGIMAAHVLLETARDALFLASIPADRLPWVYLAIAGVALGIGQIQKRRVIRHGECKILGGWLMTASVVTFAFYFLLPRLGAAGLYALYVWSGVLATLVVIHFWTLVADRFSVSQAKRLYSLIGVGSVLGAIGGTGAARILVDVWPANTLVLAAAIVLAITAMVPVPRLHSECGERKSDPRGHRSALVATLQDIGRHPYASRLALLVLLSTIALTVADFVFKSVVAETIPEAELGRFFASLYLAVNVLSLVVQLVVVGWVLRNLSVSWVLAVLPMMLLGAGAFMLASGGVLAAMLMKGSEGSLRHSLHRTASELLYVPLGESLRARAKAAIDVLGQRGGQALASLAILGAASLGWTTAWFTIVLIALTVAWLLLAYTMKRHYIRNFRDTLDRHASPVSEFPELDVASLESLIAALNSQNDAQVLAALEILEEENNAHLIPALILHHPSRPVVDKALNIFVRADRQDLIPVLDRVLRTAAESRIRGALLRGRTALAPDQHLLESYLLDPAHEVRMTAMLELVSHHWRQEDDAVELFSDMMADPSAEVRAELADALGRGTSSRWHSLLMQLAEDGDASVERHATESMARQSNPLFLEIYIRKLAHRPLRPNVQAAICDYRDVGLAALAGALEDPTLPATIRWQVPRAIANFGNQHAADLLVDRLYSETDGMVRWRLVRALEIMKRGGVEIEAGRMDAVIDAVVRRAFALIACRLGLEHGAQTSPEYRGELHDTLVQLLAAKEESAADLTAHLIGVNWPDESMVSVVEALGHKQPGPAWDSAIEVLSEVLVGEHRAAVLALFSDAPDRERLRTAGKFGDSRTLDYAATLAELATSSSRALADLAEAHIAALGLQNAPPSEHSGVFARPLTMPTLAGVKS